MSIKRIQLRRGTSEALAAANEVLLAGELCIETDTGKYKFDDGSTAWNDLKYGGGESSGGDSLDNFSHETWTMTLEDDTEITKEVVTWTSQE